MSTLRPDASDLNGLATSIREQIAESQHALPAKGGRKSPYLIQLNDLQDQVATLLDLLDTTPYGEADNENSGLSENFSVTTSIPLSSSADTSGPTLFETLNRHLARWQAQITLAYSQGASHELADCLQLAIQLSDSVQQRELRLESQRQALERATATMLEQQARTQSQRRAIAQALRAQKAELLLECELQRQKLADEIQQQRLLESDLPTADANSNPSDASTAECQWELQRELHEVKAELERTQQDLHETTELLQELEQSQANRTPNANTWSGEDESSLIYGGPAACGHAADDTAADEAAERIAELESRLASYELQLADLREQNFDLASQVAKHQVSSSGHTPHISFDSSTLTWEERKKLIMRQLEDETDESYENNSHDTAEHASLKIEIERVLSITQAEIDRRDADIAELQSIIEQQSDTRQGVAIGAAAFAQAFDSDEIIQQERQKLKEMQLQWEEKLRQAEIDVSLERAKLSRERTQLEQELEATKREKAAVDTDPSPGKRRKWLEHLGLREEKRN